MKKKTISVEELARITNRSFKELGGLMDLGFEKLTEAVVSLTKGVEQNFQHVNARLDTIEHDVAEIRKHFVYRDEFENVIARLSVIEKKLGIRGGK